MIKKITLYILCTLCTLIFTPQKNFAQKIDWQSPQYYDTLKSKKNKLLISLHADWCGWCKKMQAETFSNPKLSYFVNQHFDAVSFDTENQQELTWENTKYKFIPEYNAHEWALMLTKNNPALPTTIIINPKNHSLYTFRGFLGIADMERILKFFTSIESEPSKELYEKFMLTFKPEW